MRQEALFGGARLQMSDSIRLTIESLFTYGSTHQHWAIAWSGGKDSTVLLTMVVWILLSAREARRGAFIINAEITALLRLLRAPKSLTVLYADTRMEIPPLWQAACSIRDELTDKAADLAENGCTLVVRTVMAPIDHRFFVYMLGRGVPPPSTRFRWCTDKLKIQPMAEELRRLVEAERQTPPPPSEAIAAVADDLRQKLGDDYEVIGPRKLSDKILLLTGLRVGESAARDDRIAIACGRDGGECGQGWYQESLDSSFCDTLAPILHMRVCHVWEWLKHWAERIEFGDWSTALLADAYGGDEAEEKNARTGCVDCNLVEEDRALKYSSRLDGWTHLQLLVGALKAIYAEMKKPQHRLRQPGGERRKDGKLALNQQRLGPLLLTSRIQFLDQILEVQARVNAEADRIGAPRLNILNAEEEARIRELVAANTWPDGWNGDEPEGDVMLDRMFADGTIQPLLRGFGEGT